MKRSALAQIALAIAAIILAPEAAARADAQEEGPTEIEKCQTIGQPGSYKLVKNLTFAGTGACLEIAADFVTIDLAGFSITTVTPGAGTEGILAEHSFRGATVRNGSIMGFGEGVVLSSESIVEELRVEGGSLIDGSGITATGIVTGNYVAGNGHGMEIGAGSTVIGNTALGNRVEGITVDCPSNVADNTAVNTFEGPNLTLNGAGCNNTNNVAP